MWFGLGTKLLDRCVVSSFVSKRSQFFRMEVDLGGMRYRYTSKGHLVEDHAAEKDPTELFDIWFKEACECHTIKEPNAVNLATATRDGKPSNRMVLLKGFGKEGFKFFTNYRSRKGRELEENPNAAMTFYWEPLLKSVRIEGVVVKLSDKESTEYFQSRPFGSQVAAAVSLQSQVLPSYGEFLNKYESLFHEMVEKSVVPRPSHWGGFRIIPHTIEFWQGQDTRLHDRIRFRRQKVTALSDSSDEHMSGSNEWTVERLYP